MLTPLAEGADRLVARGFSPGQGRQLEAVLPMNERDYAADFETADRERNSRTLLLRARSLWRLPASTSRSEAYAQAGRYVVDHCDILIALWDGKPEEGPGGTAEIVRYAREKRRALAWIDPGDAGPVKIEDPGGSIIS